MFFACISKKKMIFSVFLSLLFLFSCSFLSFSGYCEVFSGSNLRQKPIYSVERSDNKIAISFDCAWGTDYTDKLLNVMEKENVKCTFFCVEFWSKKYPDYLKKISEAGHEIGTHSSTHPYMSKLSKERIREELISSSRIIEETVGKKVELFRPPYGDYSDTLIETAKEMGLYTIQWTVDSLDWKNLSATEITERVVKGVNSGSIVLFHNQGLHTHEALPRILSTLKSKGFSFVPIGELIYRDDYRVLQDGKQVKSV